LFLKGLGRRQDLGGVVTGVVLFVVKVEGKGEGEAFEVEVELEATGPLEPTPSRWDEDVGGKSGWVDVDVDVMVIAPMFGYALLCPCSV
jgi:hypothetical protein